MSSGLLTPTYFKHQILKYIRKCNPKISTYWEIGIRIVNLPKRVIILLAQKHEIRG